MNNSLSCRENTQCCFELSFCAKPCNESHPRTSTSKINFMLHSVMAHRETQEGVSSSESCMKQDASDKPYFLTPHSQCHVLVLVLFDVLNGDFYTVCERLLRVIRNEEEYPKTYLIIERTTSFGNKMILNLSFMSLSGMPDLQKPL